MLTNKGFGLVQVMVASVLMGLLALGMISIFNNSNKATNAVKGRSDLNDLQQILKLMAYQGASCQNAFKDAGGADVPYLRQATSIAAIRMGTQDIATLGPRGGVRVTGLSIEPLFPISTGAGSAAAATHPINIRIRAVPGSGGGAFGAQSFDATVALGITTDAAGIVQSCAMSDELTSELICQALGLVPDPVTRQCGTLVKASECTREGEFVKNIDADGTPHCGTVGGGTPALTPYQGETIILGYGTYCMGTPRKVATECVGERDLNAGCDKWCREKKGYSSGGAVNGTCKNNEAVGTRQNPGVRATCLCNP